MLYKAILISLAAFIYMKENGTTSGETRMVVYTEPIEVKLQNPAVTPSQIKLPSQVNYNPKYSCKKRIDWSDNFKCPKHHKYVYSKIYTKESIPRHNGRYGGYACRLDVVCSNIYDADRIGSVYMG